MPGCPGKGRREAEPGQASTFREERACGPSTQEWGARDELAGLQQKGLHGGGGLLPGGSNGPNHGVWRPQGPGADRLSRATPRPYLWQVTEDQRVLQGAEMGIGDERRMSPGCVSPSSIPMPSAEVGIAVGGLWPWLPFLGLSH